MLGHMVIFYYLLKKILSPLNDLGTFVENQFTIGVGIYFTVHSMTFRCLIGLSYDSTTYLDYYSFVVSFRILNYESFIFVLFEDCFGSLRSLNFHINFRIANCYNKAHQYFDRICVESVDQFGEIYNILTFTLLRL